MGKGRYLPQVQSYFTQSVARDATTLRSCFHVLMPLGLDYVTSSHASFFLDPHLLKCFRYRCATTQASRAWKLQLLLHPPGIRHQKQPSINLLSIELATETVIINMAGRSRILPLAAGAATAGGVGYYLYTAGGDPKVAKKEISRRYRDWLHVHELITSLQTTPLQQPTD